MIPSLSQETFTQYASDAQTIQEPTGADYSRGVSVGRTIPAKWWNWLFSNATKRIVQSRNDADNMLTEMKNVVTDAGLTPIASDNTQLTQAIEAKTDEQIDKYIEGKKGYFIDWASSPVTMNLPSGQYAYVQGGATLAQVGYVRATPTASSEIYVDAIYEAYTTDGVSWGPTIKFSFSTPIARVDSNMLKFKNRYFKFFSGTSSTSWQNTCYTYIYVSDDLVNWELYRKIVLVSTNQAVAVNNFRPSMAVTNDALYLITREGTDYIVNTTTHLFKTTDGYNWSEIASGFNYGGVPEFGSIKEVGNGFYWGNYIFNGSTVTPVFTGNGGVSNPIVFSSGKALFIDADSHKYYSLNSMIDTPQEVTLSTQYFVDYRMLLGNTKAVLTTSYAQEGIPVSTQISFLDDNLNETPMPNLSGDPSSTTKYVPFERDGIVYSDRYKTTDLVNWTEIDTMPEGARQLRPTVAPGVFYCLVRVSSSNKWFVSIDNLNTWKQAEKLRLGALMFGANCWNSYSGSTYEALGGVITLNSINRVIGHTLYLR